MTNPPFFMPLKAPLSSCCSAPVFTGGEGLTHFFVCEKCHKACDMKFEGKTEAASTCCNGPWCPKNKEYNTFHHPDEGQGYPDVQKYYF